MSQVDFFEVCLDEISDGLSLLDYIVVVSENSLFWFILLVEFIVDDDFDLPHGHDSLNPEDNVPIVDEFDSKIDGCESVVMKNSGHFAFGYWYGILPELIFLFYSRVIVYYLFCFFRFYLLRGVGQFIELLQLARTLFLVES